VPTPTSRRPGITTWLIAWVVFSVLGGLWALASPILSVPDESSHAVYAAAAARGQIWAPAIGTETFVQLPADYKTVHDINGCYVFQPNVAAGCAPEFSPQAGEVEITTRAGRYPPAYYAFAGLGSLVTDGAKAIYAMRLLTVALVAGFLASATCSILGRRNRAMGLVGLGLATTPMLFFFAGAVNPQSPEIAASILLWVSGTALLTRLRDEPDVPLTFANADLRRVLIALVALPLIRPLSLFWLAVIVAGLLLAFGSWPAIRRLLTARPVLVGLPVVLAAIGSNLWWVFVRDAMVAEDLTGYATLRAPEAMQISVAKLSEEYDEMIGVFGWLSTPAPGAVYVLFSLLLGGLALLTALQSRARQNITVTLLAVAVMATPVMFEMLSYRTSQFGWQGRYTLPIAVGIPLLLGMSDGASRLTGPVPRRFLLTASAGLVVIHVLSFLGALDRHVFGINGFWGITDPGWAPPLGFSSLVLGALLVTVAGAVLANRAAAQEEAVDVDGDHDDYADHDDHDDRSHDDRSHDDDETTQFERPVEGDPWSTAPVYGRGRRPVNGSRADAEVH
jgi:hypothetical protein